MSLRMLICFVLTCSSVYAAHGHREFSDEAATSLLRTGNVEVTNVIVETLMQTSWPSSKPNQYDHIRDLRRQVTTTAKCKKAGGPCTKLDCCSTLTCDPLASTCAKPPKTTKSKSTKTTKTSTKSRKTDTTTTALQPTTTLTTSAILTTTPVVSSTSSICVNPPEGLQCFKQGCCPGYTCVADYSAHSTAGYCSPTGLPTSATQPATSSTTVSAIVTTTTQAVSTSKAATCNTDPAVDCYSRGCCAGYSCVANYHASSTAGSCSLTSFPSSTTTSDVVSTTPFTTTSAVITTTTQAITTSTAATCLTDPAFNCYSQRCCAGYSCAANYHASSTAGSCTFTGLPSSTTTSNVASTTPPTTFATSTTTVSVCVNPSGVQCVRSGCCSGYTCFTDFSGHSTSAYCLAVAATSSSVLSTTTFNAVSTTSSSPLATSATTASVCVNPPEGLQCFSMGCCSGYTCVADHSSPTTAGYCSPIVAATTSALPQHSTTAGAPIPTTTSPAPALTSAAADTTSSTTRPAKQTTTPRTYPTISTSATV